MAATLAGLVFILFIFNAPVNLFRDGDAGWHIRAGELILRTHGLPQEEPFSFLALDPPWRAWEWGAEVVMAMAHRAGGLPAVVFLYTAALAAAFWLWFRLHLWLGGDVVLACLMASPFVATTNMHWLARPHLFSFVFLLLLLFWLERERPGVRAADIGITFAGAAVWANMHASWVLVPLFSLLYAIAYLWRPWLWAEADPAEDRRRAGVYALLALAGGLGSLVNPYGWRLHLHMIDFFRSPFVRVGIAEWEPLGWDGPGLAQVAIVVIFCLAGAVCALRQRRLHHCLVFGFLLWTGLGAARGLPLLAIAGLPLANSAITATLARRGGRAPRWFAFTARLRQHDRAQSGAALLPVALLLVFLYLTSPAVAQRTGFPAQIFPVEAVPALEALPDGSRLFASIVHGGYIIYRFEGRRKVFIDGRIDYYGSRIAYLYRGIAGTAEGWDMGIRSLGITHVLTGNAEPLAMAAAERGWRPLHRDERFSLFEVPAASNQPTAGAIPQTAPELRHAR